MYRANLSTRRGPCCRADVEVLPFVFKGKTGLSAHPRCRRLSAVAAFKNRRPKVRPLWLFAFRGGLDGGWFFERRLWQRLLLVETFAGF